MHNRKITAITLFNAAAAAIYSSTANASFNSLGNGPFCRSIDCVLWVGWMLGIIGIPVFILIFFGLSRIFRSPLRPGVNQSWVLMNAVVAYSITVALLLRRPAHDHLYVYVFLAYTAFSVLYLRYFPPLFTEKKQAEGRNE